MLLFLLSGWSRAWRTKAGTQKAVDRIAADTPGEGISNYWAAGCTDSPGESAPRSQNWTRGDYSWGRGRDSSSHGEP